MIICEDCGNTKQFMRIARYQVVKTMEHFVNGKDEDDIVKEGDDIDIEEEEFEEYEGDAECCECGNEFCETGLSERDILEVQYEHTRKDGTWSEEELDEEERDDAILAKIGVLAL